MESRSFKVYSSSKNRRRSTGKGRGAGSGPPTPWREPATDRESSRRAGAPGVTGRDFRRCRLGRATLVLRLGAWYVRLVSPERSGGTVLLQSPVTPTELDDRRGGARVCGDCAGLRDRSLMTVDGQRNSMATSLTSGVAPVLDLLAVAALVADNTGQVVASNRAWRELTGRTQAESTGYGWAQVLDASDRLRFMDLLADLSTNGDTITAEYQLRVADRRSWTRWGARRPYDDGAPMVITVVDIYQYPARYDRHRRQANVDNLTLANRAPTGDDSIIAGLTSSARRVADMAHAARPDDERRIHLLDSAHSIHRALIDLAAYVTKTPN